MSGNLYLALFGLGMFILSCILYFIGKRLPK